MTDKITIHINLNEKDEEITIPLLEGDSVEWAKNEVRTGWNVTGGFLSSRQDRIEAVRTLSAGSVYYFLGFQVAQPVPQLQSGKY